MKLRPRHLAFGLLTGAAALVWDPNAHASEPKRVLLLLLALAGAAHAVVTVGGVAPDAPGPPRASRSVVTPKAMDPIVAESVGARTRGEAAPRSWMLFAGVLALSALSAIWGSSRGLLDLAVWFGAGVCAVVAAREGRAFALLTARTAAVAIGGAVSVWALGGVVVGQRGFALAAGQGNPNWLGLLLVLTLPLSLDAVGALRASRAQSNSPSDSGVGDLREPVPRESRGLHGRSAYWICIASTIVQPAALYASHSRVGWIAGGAALLWMIVGAPRRLRRLRAAIPLCVGAALLVVGTMAAERTSTPSRPAQHRPARTTFEPPSPEDAPAARSFAGRRWIAARSLEAVRRSGIFGTGLGGFGTVYLETQGRALNELSVRAAARTFVNATTAHDEPLQVAVESGPIAALLLVLALAFAIRDHHRARSVAGAAATIALAISALGDSPLRQPAVCIVFALVCATLPTAPASARWLGASSAGARLPRARAVVSRVAWASALAMAASLLVQASRAWLGTRTLESAFVVAPEERHRRLSKAVRIDPTSPDAWLALGLHELGEGHADLGVTRLARAEALAPSLATRVALGSAHLARRDPRAARDALMSAIAIAPGSLRARLALAEAERQLGHLDEATRHASAARAVAPGDPHVAEIADRLGEDAMEAAARVDR